MRGGAHTIILLGYAVWLAWSETITVTIDDNMGNNTLTCGTGNSTPCHSLDYVISERLKPLNSSCNGTLSILIRSGNYSYSLNGSDSNYQFIGYGHLQITGDSSDVNVNCTPGGGFAFINCSNINITNVKLHHCGALQPGTSTTGKDDNVTIPVSTALYFAFCGNITLLNVYVDYSITTGVVMYNTGNLSVLHSHFLNNSFKNDPEGELLGNGGFYIEFCYCDPGISHENCTPHNNTNASYSFLSSSFKGNNALNVNSLNRTFYIPYKNDYVSFGRGGGLSIVFKGNASDNVVTVDNCNLHENAALWGGGVFVEFEDDSVNNSVTFSNTAFWFNQVVNDSPTNGTGGGGARVDFLFFNKSLEGFHGNNVTFNGCQFFNNSANHGAGLSLLTTPEHKVLLSTNILTLNNCTFVKNIGAIGAAMDLSTWHSIKIGLPATVIIENCTFSNNGLNNTDGGVYADCVPATFYGTILFASNNGSALSVFGTGVTFAEGCQAQFTNNKGWSGGAISLLGNAYISIHPGVNFTFYNNSAFVEGGAIYALLTSRHDILSSRNCFLQYTVQTIHPDDWNVTFKFINNYAPMGRSIYTTSLVPCAWGASYGNISYNLKKVFKWKNFTYVPDNCTQISSGIASLSQSNHTSVNVDVAPGNITRLPVHPVDDWDSTTKGSSWLYSYNTKVSVYPNLTADYKVAAKGRPGESAEVLMVTDSARNVSLTLNIRLQQCPPGYKWNEDIEECECAYQDWDGILYCNDTSFTSHLVRGYWAGYLLSFTYNIANESSLVTVRCPSQYCNKIHTPLHRQLPKTANNDEVDHMICGPQNRTGNLCGNCTNDNGVAINVRAFQFNCIYCSSTKYSWLVYIASEFLPLTLFFIIILFFDINIHSGVTSSIILYFQVFDALRIVSDDELPPPPDSSDLIQAIQFLYNIWNLQFFGSLLSPYCLASGLNTMDVLMINYASGLFPFLLFFVVYLLKNLSCSCWSGSETFRQLCYYFRRCWYHLKWRVAVKKSMLSGLATVWTLAFTKLALISFLILSRTSLNADTAVVTYQGTLPFLRDGHLLYAIPANIIIIILVFLPATGLLCYPLIPQLMGRLRRQIPLDHYVVYNTISSVLERPFIKLKPIIDCFQGSYRPRCEFFAGLLFWYRLAIFIVFAYSVQSDTYFWNITISLAFLVIVGIAQPFKKSRDNSVMLLSVANIIMISVLNIYLLDHYHGDRGSSYDPTVLQWWQLVLVVLPLIFITFYVLWKAKKKVQAWKRGVPAEGLYVNFSTYDGTPAEDPLLNFPAQIWDESHNVDDADDDSMQDYNYREGSSRSASNSMRHDHQHSSRRVSNRTDLDSRRSRTFSGRANSNYGTINDD